MSKSIIENLNQLDQQIYRSISAHPSLTKIDDIELYTSDEHIRIRGTVGTYFEKQMAGETLRTLDKERKIENELLVSWD